MPREVIRAGSDEKETQINNLARLKEAHQDTAASSLKALQQVARNGENLFESLLEVSKTCSLGQITGALYAVGGKYRRNM